VEFSPSRKKLLFVIYTPGNSNVDIPGSHIALCVEFTFHDGSEAELPTVSARTIEFEPLVDVKLTKQAVITRSASERVYSEETLSGSGTTEDPWVVRTTVSYETRAEPYPQGMGVTISVGESYYEPTTQPGTSTCVVSNVLLITYGADDNLKILRVKNIYIRDIILGPANAGTWTPAITVTERTQGGGSKVVSETAGYSAFEPTQRATIRNYRAFQITLDDGITERVLYEKEFSENYVLGNRDTVDGSELIPYYRRRFYALANEIHPDAEVIFFPPTLPQSYSGDAFYQVLVDAPNSCGSNGAKPVSVYSYNFRHRYDNLEDLRGEEKAVVTLGGDVRVLTDKEYEDALSGGSFWACYDPVEGQLSLTPHTTWV
jgi:hypothetical protein